MWDVAGAGGRGGGGGRRMGLQWRRVGGAGGSRLKMYVVTTRCKQNNDCIRFLVIGLHPVTKPRSNHLKHAARSFSLVSIPSHLL
jgi:hypothetical protein